MKKSTIYDHFGNKDRIRLVNSILSGSNAIEGIRTTITNPKRTIPISER